MRYIDYIGVAQIYLKDNFFLKEELKANHLKDRPLGHWGTVPGLNFIYANANYLIKKHKCECLFIAGPGHGAPAVLANLYAEGTLEDFYKDYKRNADGFGRIIRDFSWPHTKFPSHVTPGVPGSILEGGELGYSLATAFGAVMDNPELIAVTVVGDGEAETGPIAAAWHSNKFLNPKTSGAVLPIVHVNGYKISNPTLFGTMSSEELENLFKGYGYEPLIVEGKDLDKKMMAAMEKAYQKIRTIQKAARKKGKVLKPIWPVIILRSPKGWGGIHNFKNELIEGTFHSHGVPIESPKKNPEAMYALEKWLKIYKINDLVDSKGRPKKEVLEFVPSGGLRMGMCKYAFGGKMLKEIKLPKPSKYEMRFKKRGEMMAGSMTEGGKMIRDVFSLNKKNFRVFCPDELESNKLSAIFEETKRAYVWPINEYFENISPDGRAMEILSEHTLQGWMQGYLLTGRHGIFVTYEAFAPIISSMIDQYAKFLKQSFQIKWRKPIAGATYILTSLGWRQDHNGFSHQNPSFVSGVLQKHGEFCQIYYPADANSLLVALQESLKKKDSINVIVAGKTPMPQWLSLKEAEKQANGGMDIWEWATGKEASREPDVVLAAAGDYMTEEALYAVGLCKKFVPELKIRFVNVSELTGMKLGDNFVSGRDARTEFGVNYYLTADKPVVFNYHGYTNDIEQILWPYVNSSRFSIHGYQERGSTTTPFDMKIANEVSRYHLAIDLINQGSKSNEIVAKKREKAIAYLNEIIIQHQLYIKEYGDDPEEIKNMKWN